MNKSYLSNFLNNNSLVIVSFTVGFVYCLNSSAEIVEKTVALVNSEVVLATDIQALQKKSQLQNMLDEALLTSGSIEDIRTNRKIALEYLINEKIMDSEVKRLNLQATEDKIDQEIRDMAKRNNIEVNDLYNAMRGQGLSKGEYRHFLKSKIERQAIIETEIISKLRISDEDALAEYVRTHPDRKSTVQEFTVAHIFFNPKKSSVEKSVEKAEIVLGKLSTGEKFEDLAEQFSEDPNFTTGGLLGSFKSGEVSPEIEKSIQGLNPGQTTKIIKTKLGVHIVKLLDRKVTSDPRFEKERERIKAGLLESAFKKQLKRWLLQKRDEAFIKLNEVTT